jgi:tetratricopeptide (TPR) repeat protein
LRLVIASPGDVTAEREIIPRVVEEVNRNIARPRGLHLDVYCWETDSYPGFHPQGPQGLIDPILKIEECGILIGIFWRRFGTPVSDAKSGTEHEFRLAYEAWKKNGKPQIMVYFSQKSYTPKSREETDQWGLVLQFKKDFPREGLWWEYKTRVEFEQLTRNHLTNFLSQQFPLDKPTPAVPAALTPLFQLPPPPADFTGRTSELAELRAAIEKTGVHISGLQGQGGVGKTALALKLAAELAPIYPDAQIYLDLKGVSENPLTAAEAMSHVLRTFHPEAKLPEKEEDLRALYLDVLHNKRAVLLMDNAKEAAQLKLLVPPDECMFLVTSRTRFTLPGLYQKDLTTFPPGDGTRFLLEIAPRIKGEAETIARLCGYLPLALRLAGTAIAERADLDPADYRQRLTDEKHRLKLLGGKKEESMEASIALSYNLLADDRKKQWRMLSVFPDTFDAPAAGTVWEVEEDAAKDTLSDLKQLSMLEWDNSTKRYRLHDLMRAFARGKLSEEEREAADLRHARHYLEVICLAGDLYTQGGDSMMRGLALFDLEWGNIQAGQSWAAARAESDRDASTLCNEYPGYGADIFALRQHPRESIRWREAALTAARKLKHRQAEGVHLGNLGITYDALGEYRRAVESHEKCLDIARETGDRLGEGQALGNLGLAYHSLGDYRRAIEHYEKQLEITREIGDRRGEGNSLGNLGVAYDSLGEYRRAIEYQEQRLAIAREIGDRRGEGNSLGNLGVAYDCLGEYRRAIEYHEQSMTIKRDIGNRRGEGNSLGSLGNAYFSLGEYRRAIGYYEQGLAVARETGDRYSEGTALWNMSLALDELGDRKGAIEHAEAALKILEEIENPKAPKVRKQLDIWKNG